MSEQLLLNFDRPAIEPETEHDLSPAPDVDPSKLPGAYFNGKLWVSDLDIPF